MISQAAVTKTLEIVFQRFPSRRSVVFGTKGVVASPQPLATQVGLEILGKGGNAADAAVAVSAALNVTEPSSCGIGGDAFCLFFDAVTKKVKGINGSGRSPRKLTIDYVRKRGISGRHIPLADLNAVTVPGAAAAWVDTIERFGSGSFSLAEVLQPAVRLAEEGVPVFEINSRAWQLSEDFLKRASPNGHEMLLHGRAPLPGQIISMPNLAKTFRALAEEGADGFYKGRVANEIVKLIDSKGGVMELDDLARHRSSIVDPLQYTYANEYTVYECPPNGQGITALLGLGILENIQEQCLSRPLLKMEHNSAEYLHTLIEALRLAFADSQYYVTDPEMKHVPVEELLSKRYLSARAKLFDPMKANPRVIHGNPVHSSDTVYFSVTDQWGNACSFIQSNYTGFGTGAVPAGCGFTLQNRGAGFVLEEGHPNALEGSKRPYHTIIPAMVMRQGELFLSYGVMGGFMQPQGHIQVLLNVLRGFNVQEALDAPRFCISAGSPGLQGNSEEAGDVNSAIYLEEGILPSVVRQLREMGHDAHSITGFDREQFGRGQVIRRVMNTSGTLVWAAGSDPRADGNAAAQI